MPVQSKCRSADTAPSKGPLRIELILLDTLASHSIPFLPHGQIGRFPNNFTSVTRTMIKHQERTYQKA